MENIELCAYTSGNLDAKCVEQNKNTPMELQETMEQNPIDSDNRNEIASTNTVASSEDGSLDTENITHSKTLVAEDVEETNDVTISTRLAFEIIHCLQKTKLLLKLRSNRHWRSMAGNCSKALEHVGVTTKNDKELNESQYLPESDIAEFRENVNRTITVLEELDGRIDFTDKDVSRIINSLRDRTAVLLTLKPQRGDPTGERIIELIRWFSNYINQVSIAKFATAIFLGPLTVLALITTLDYAYNTLNPLELLRYLTN